MSNLKEEYGEMMLDVYNVPTQNPKPKLAKETTNTDPANVMDDKVHPVDKKPVITKEIKG